MFWLEDKNKCEPIQPGAVEVAPGGMAAILTAVIAAKMVKKDD